MRTVHFGPPEYLHHVTHLVFQRSIHARGAHLRPLRINHDTDMGRNGTHVLHDIAYAVGRCMGRIHTNDIHSGKEKLADEILFTSAIAYRGYYFRLFHVAILNFPTKLAEISHNTKYSARVLFLFTN